MGTKTACADRLLGVVFDVIVGVIIPWAVYKKGRAVALPGINNYPLLRSLRLRAFFFLRNGRIELLLQHRNDFVVID